MTKFYQWLAGWLPAELVYFAAIRLMAYATSIRACHDATKLHGMDAINVWEKDKGI